MLRRIENNESPLPPQTPEAPRQPQAHTQPVIIVCGSPSPPSYLTPIQIIEEDETEEQFIKKVENAYRESVSLFRYAHLNGNYRAPYAKLKFIIEHCYKVDQDMRGDQLVFAVNKNTSPYAIHHMDRFRECVLLMIQISITVRDKDDAIKLAKFLLWLRREEKDIVAASLLEEAYQIT